MDFMIKDNKNDKIISSAKTIDELSDGYHTFKELYDFRREYNAALVNSGIWKAHKSYRHHDGELCFGGGWFIVMINTPFGQISNHYENEYWDEFHCEEKEVADEWDGHTEKDVLNRLHYSNKWNIKDAKDGDVIQLGTVTAIFKKYIGEEKCICYCSFCEDGGFEIPIENGEDNIYGCYNATPATKEQRDLLFPKMKEACYEWDVDKKELKLVKPKFKVGDWIITPENKVLQITSIGDTTYGFNNESHYWAICYCDEQCRFWTIQDAKDGDVLCCKSGWMCIFKTLNNHTNTFSSYCFMDGDKCFFNIGIDGHTLDKKFINAYNGEIYPATKEQRDLLFQKMKEACYEWDVDKKELKKVKPKFKVGDWIITPTNNVLQITSIEGRSYKFNNKSHYLAICYCDEKCRFWTIKDAKDGDILAFDNDTIVIFKDLYNSESFHSYCHIEDGIFGFSEDESPDWWNSEGFKPATKEQRDTLMKAINDAGYEWDTEKKELKNKNQK